MQFVLTCCYPLYRIRVVFLFKVLNIGPHLSERVNLVGARLRVKQKRLVVTRIQCDQVKFGLAIHHAVFKNQVTGTQPEIAFYLLLDFGRFDMNIACCF